MPRFYNKATSTPVKKTTMSESERLVYKKSDVCSVCPMPLLVGVDQKHASYDRYLNYLRKNL